MQIEDYDVIDEREVGISPLLKLKRILLNNPSITFPNKLEKDKLKFFCENIPKKDLGCIMHENLELSYVLLGLLIKNDIYGHVPILNTTTVLDIWLGKNLEYTSLNELNSEAICIFHGYNEAFNLRQEDVILQVVSRQEFLNKKCFFIFRGTAALLKQSLPKVESYFRSRGLLMGAPSSDAPNKTTAKFHVSHKK